MWEEIVEHWTIHFLDWLVDWLIFIQGRWFHVGNRNCLNNFGLGAALCRERSFVSRIDWQCQNFDFSVSYLNYGPSKLDLHLLTLTAQNTAPSQGNRTLPINAKQSRVWNCVHDIRSHQFQNHSKLFKELWFLTWKNFHSMKDNRSTNQSDKVMAKCFPIFFSHSNFFSPWRCHPTLQDPFLKTTILVLVPYGFTLRIIWAMKVWIKSRKRIPMGSFSTFRWTFPFSRDFSSRKSPQVQNFFF